MIIENIELKYDGSIIKNWEELFDMYPGKDTLYLARSNDVLNNSVLLPGEEITVIDSKENTQLAKVLYEMMEEMKLKVCYTSIYKDLFHDIVKGLDNRVTNDVEEISFCKIRQGANFQD